MHEYLFLTLKPRHIRKDIRENDRVSEWLLLKAKSAIFQLCHGENNLIFYGMMMRSALY
jgi:hypothetical protein